MSNTYSDSEAVSTSCVNFRGLHIDTDFVIITSDKTYEDLINLGVNHEVIYTKIRQTAISFRKHPIEVQAQEMFLSFQEECKKRVTTFITSYEEFIDATRKGEYGHIKIGRYNRRSHTNCLRLANILDQLKDWGVVLYPSQILPSVKMSRDERNNFLIRIGDEIIDTTMNAFCANISKNAGPGFQLLAIAEFDNDEPMLTVMD